MIPSKNKISLSILQLIVDKQPHQIREVTDEIAKHFDLSEKERQELTAVAKRPKFDVRVRWAVSELRNAALLENLKLGIFKITPRGLNELKKNPKKIDAKFLMQFPEYRKFVGITESGKISESSKEYEKPEISPIEILEENYEILNRDLKKQILSEIKQISPFTFENLVVELLLKMGYGGFVKKGIVTKKTRDGGIDGVIKADELGLNKIYIQAKRWNTDVGKPEIQKFVGALSEENADKGIFITTSGFRKNVKDLRGPYQNKIVLLDGNKLAEFMIKYDLGVISSQKYEIKRLDSGFFEEI